MVDARDRSGVVDAAGKRGILDPDGRLVNNKTCGELMQVRPDVSDDARRLTLVFPSGEAVGGVVMLGAAVETSFYGRPVAGSVVVGGYAEALSAYWGTGMS